jgi:replicative DNA helicase
MKNHQWSSLSDVMKPAVSYIRRRMDGTQPIFKTKWKSFNDAHAGGLEINNTTVIAGRPGFGKTAIKDQLIRDIIECNKDFKYSILDIQMELSKRTSGIRQLSSLTGKSYKELISCEQEGVLTKEDLEKVKEEARKVSEFNKIRVISKPLRVSEFVSIVEKYMEAYSELVKKTKIVDKVESIYVDKVWEPTVIFIDHSLLFIKGTSSENDLLDELFRNLTILKNQFPIAFVVLHQMNRDIESPIRCQESHFLNYPRSTDLRGSDVVYHHSDVLLLLNRPFKVGIQRYGPEQIKVYEKFVAGHYLKARNNFVRLSLYNLDGKTYNITEISLEESEQLARIEESPANTAGNAIETVI